ncbi:MAG: GNAT family N-acetyltransferase [Chloroflexota bacterium]|nr:GNAT family N-acetyltransferase [Chloroflexota bacterium]
MSGLRFHQAPSPKPGRTDIWAERDGELVCSLEVMAAPVRLAGATLRTAGIANVFTEEGHRRRGYASALMAHVHEVLVDAGYSTVALFGIPGFYGQFGYATIGCDFALEVDTDVAAQAVGGHRLRLATAADLPEVAEMYNAVNADLDGSVVRDPADWIGLRHGSTILGTTGLWIAEDAAGESVGYLALREDAGGAEAIDGGFTESAVAPSLVAHAAAEAVKRQASTIRFELHPEFGLGSHVRRMECRLESIRPLDAGYMLCLLDQDSVLGAIEPALRARAVAHGLRAPSRLRITTALGTTAVELGGPGPERTLTLPHERLTQLLFGYWSAAEVAEVERAGIAQEDVPWLTALFPRGDAYCYEPDRY